MGACRAPANPGGFLSAGALSSDQLNGAGLSYRLTEDSGQLGSVYGVVAYVPGPPMNLTAPAVIEDIAYAVGKINASQIAGGVASNSRSQLALNSSLALTKFNAPVPDAPIGGLSSGTAQLVDNGVNAATGIRWGRWEGGAIEVTTPPAGTQVNDLSTQSLHWILSNEYASTPVLPQSGTANFTLVGNTAPTDTLGHVGTLGTASFTADFTNRFVASQLTLNVNGVAWYASGSASYGIGNNKFEGDVRRRAHSESGARAGRTPRILHPAQNGQQHLAGRGPVVQSHRQHTSARCDQRRDRLCSGRIGYDSVAAIA